MRRRVYVIVGEFSANPRYLRPEQRSAPWLAEPAPEPSEEELVRLFFRYPNRSDDGRAKPEDWERDFGLPTPVGLVDLLASSAHRALSTLHALLGEKQYPRTCERVTDLIVTSMPGLDPNERMNIGLVPQLLQAQLRLSRRASCQFVVGTSDSGAWAFAQAVRAARTSERPATVLVVAGQVMPAGYASQYQIRTVLGEEDQARGLDMLVVGDLLMDSMRRTQGRSRAEVEEFLARVSERKFAGAQAYPAAMQSGRTARRSARRTPYFDGADIATPCCGAAATILTSDEELVSQVSRARLSRHARPPVVEALGVGEGSSNASFLRRQAPLVFGTAVREAFVATADDARVPLNALPSCSFAVVHDAFPSIELAFLLSLGFSWEQAADRICDGWSNPYGGLLTFGHALGASGLVQVNKTHHIFSGDRRYLRPTDGAGELPSPAGLGDMAFTTSVGGPLSHVVGALFRAGRQAADTRLEEQAEPSLAGVRFTEQRAVLRKALPVQLQALAARGDPAALVEGVTYVSVRSCLRALAPADVSAMEFDGLEYLVRPERLEDIRYRLRELVSLVVRESERLASLFDVFRVLTDEVRAMASEWRRTGVFVAELEALPEQRLADQLKECLRVPLAVTCELEHSEAVRRVHFLPLDGLRYEDLASVDVLLERGGTWVPAPPESSALLLPWWDHRARRSKAPGPQDGPSGMPRLLAGGAPQSGRDLTLLRAWTALDPSPAVLEQLAEGPPRPSVPVVAYLGLAVAPPGANAATGAAQEVLARAALQARAWIGLSHTSVVQMGAYLLAACFDGDGDQPGWAAVRTVRFAREVAYAARDAGIRVCAAVVAGRGVSYRDLRGELALASPALARAVELVTLGGAERAGVRLAVELAPTEAQRVAGELARWRPVEDVGAAHVFELAAEAR
ncbi:MAG: hypothetical protein ACLQDQ_03805 [Myxococcaceae bacterium]